jgi:hypothetical protein
MFRIFSGLTLPCDTRRIRYDSYIDVMLQLLDPSILLSFPHALLFSKFAAHEKQTFSFMHIELSVFLTVAPV